MIISSGMLSEDGVPAASGGSGAGPSGSSGGQEDGEFGVDPNLDPELAMVSSAIREASASWPDRIYTGH